MTIFIFYYLFCILFTIGGSLKDWKSYPWWGIALGAILSPITTPVVIGLTVAVILD